MENYKYSDFWNFLKLLSDNNLIEHTVLIGSWAEYIYMQAGLLEGFNANLKTLDIDFLIKNLRRPASPVSIPALAKAAGYTVDVDYICGTTKIYTPELMEIEFLINQKGSGDIDILKTNLGVNAQALRHMAIIRDHTVCVNLYGINITVPEPAAYVLHKMVINNQRGEKAEKDMQAIKTLLPFIDKARFDTLFQSLTAKEKRLVQQLMQINNMS